MTFFREYDGERVLISSDVDALRAYYDKGGAIILLLDQNNKKLDTSFARYAVELGIGEGDIKTLLYETVDDEYLKEVVARHRKQPLVVAQNDVLTVRELTMADLPLLIRVYGEGSSYIEPFFNDADEASEYLYTYINNTYYLSEYGVWAIVTNAGDFAGICALTPRTENKVELGYALLKEYRGRGLATLACKEVLGNILKNIKPHSVIIKCNRENDRGINLALKMQEEFLDAIDLETI